MRLTNVRVQNYKCIDDSGEFAIEQVTALVGKNEAGKSALLEALHRFNPVKDAGGYDSLAHHPRRRLNEYEEAITAGGKPGKIITTTWELSRGDLDALTQTLGSDGFVGANVTVTRGYDNTKYFSIDHERRVVEHWIDSAELHQEERTPLAAMKTVSALIDALEKTGEKSDRHTAL